MNACNVKPLKIPEHVFAVLITGDPHDISLLFLISRLPGFGECSHLLCNFSVILSSALTSLSYEKTCILFNIAAMQSQIASGICTDISDDEALKTCARYFQVISF